MNPLIILKMYMDQLNVMVSDTDSLGLSFINDGYTVIGTSRSQGGVDIINKRINDSKSKGFGMIFDGKNK